MAAVFCASFRRSAMVRRSRVIFTRSSRSARWRGPAGTAGFGGRRRSGAGIDDSAASTSPLVARPSLPLGWIAAGATPFSSASLRTAGPEAARLAAGADAGTGARLGAGAGAGAGWRAWAAAAAGAAAAGFGVAPAPPASIVPSTPPTCTSRPPRRRARRSCRPTVACTSTVTLSVSSSHSGSSTATLSPTFTIHLATVASVTDSPRAGTLISTAMTCSPQPTVNARSTRSACSFRCVRAEPVAGDAASGRPT